MLPDYDLMRLLGRGSAGSVYLARRHGTQELLAIKHVYVGSDDSTARLRFEREARVMRSLEHESLVAVIDLVASGDDMWLVMEYVDGTTLAGALPRLGAAVSVALVRQLASVLDYVHAAGVLHRDVKPANVLLSTAGACKLSDFGVARFVGDSLHAGADNGIRTRTGTVLGSPAYMAPEVAGGQAQIDARADIYSLAVVAYRAVAGRLPFTGDAYRVVEAQINDPPPPPSGFEPALGGEVDEVLLRGLAKNPADRYATAVEFAVALATALHVDAGGGSSTWRDEVAEIVRATVADALEPRVEETADAQSSTVDLASSVSARAAPRLPAAQVPVFRPSARARIRVKALALAVVIGIAVGIIVGVVHH